MQGTVVTTTNNNVTTITFSHPAHNSMPGHQLKSLTAAINAAGENKDSTIIILQSAGDRTFCAGASFDELAAINNFEEGKKFFMGFANVINACRKNPKLIIGRVQGKAVGGGVGIAAAVDYCLATKYASIKLSELALGIGPFVVGPAVERKTGLSAFSQLAINATEWQTAQWAKDHGLYAEVLESTSELDERLAIFSSQLASMSPDALGELKRIFWAGAENWDTLLESRAEISGRLVLSDFTKSAIAKIKAKS
ncbi:MAG: enoyl-CoA hydratase/isomerase family protein [Bacteroidetes bacterium]|nr:MAG: enoyl-CoA hydratase/isomerase family protein [Bacteroidota bacterium]